jgi:hypothetical protein
VEPGLYVTFFKEGESRDSELPPVGPLEHVVYREGGLLADRKSVHQVDDSDRMSGSRWIEAELELERAIGNEPGGARRPHLRVSAREGVYLRFASFGQSAENNPAPELGPYAVVTIGPRGVDADGDLLAIPTGSKRALWDLTKTAGKDLAGVVRPDIAFRTEWSAYHPGIRTAPPEQAKASTVESALRSPVVAPMNAAAQHRREPVVIKERPPQPSPRPAPAAATLSTQSAASGPPRPVMTPRTPAPEPARYASPPPMTLFDRVSTNTRPTSSTEAYGRRSSDGLQWADALWGMRFAIIGVLVLFVGVFGFISFQNNAGAPSVNVVGVGATIKGVRWDYTVNNISRTTTAGEATSRGTYLVIRVGVKNQGSESATLFPSEFALVDSTGAEYPSLSESDGAYQSAQNSGSPYVWPHTYPVGQFATATVIFDIPNSIRGLQLVIRSVPSTRIRLD